MKIAQKQSKLPKKTIIIALALLIIGGAGAFGLYQSQQANNVAGSNQEAVRPINDVDYNPPTTTEQEQQQQTKEDIIKQNEANPTAPSTPADSAISVTISRANQGGEDQGSKGLPLNIRTIITGTNRGTCKVELKKDGQPTITKTFPIIVQATYSTCQQADIAADQFSVDGEWSLSVTASNDTSSSKPATSTVRVLR